MKQNGSVEDRAAPVAAVRWDAVLLAGVAVLVVLTHWPSAALLVDKWSKLHQAYSHGFAVLAISVWLMARALRAERLVPRPSAWGVALAFATAVGLAVARAVGIATLQELGLVFLLWAAFLALLGWEAARRLAFPVAFLLFAVPVWDVLAGPLQTATVAVNRLLLGLGDIRFTVTGNFIDLQDVGVIHVAHGCSGQNYMVVSLTLAALMAHLNLSRFRSWAMMAGVAVLVGLFTNWVRVFTIILIAYDSVMQSPLVEHHETFGWLLFLVLLVPMFFLGSRLAAGEARSGGGGGESRPIAQRPPASASTLGVALLLTTVAVTVPPAYLAWQQPDTGAVSLQAPAELAALNRTTLPYQSAWQPQWHGADAVLRASYAPDAGADRRDRAVYLGVWLYTHQEQGKELINSGNRLYDGDAWERVSARASGAAPVSYLVLRHRYSDRSVVVAYAYRVAGQWTTSPLLAKLYQAWGLVSGDRSAALVTLSANCAGDCEGRMGELSDVARGVFAAGSPLGAWLEASARPKAAGQGRE